MPSYFSARLAYLRFSTITMWIMFMACLARSPCVSSLACSNSRVQKLRLIIAFLKWTLIWQLLRVSGNMSSSVHMNVYCEQWWSLHFSEKELYGGEGKLRTLPAVTRYQHGKSLDEYFIIWWNSNLPRVIYAVSSELSWAISVMTTVFFFSSLGL